MALDSIHCRSVGLPWSKRGTRYRELSRGMLTAMDTIHPTNHRRPLWSERLLEVDGQE